MPKHINKPKPLSGKAGELFKRMPPVQHTISGEEYDTMKSELYDWMREQEDVMQVLFGRARRAGLIQYDPFMDAWVGVDYFEGQEEGHEK